MNYVQHVYDYSLQQAGAARCPYGLPPDRAGWIRPLTGDSVLRSYNSLRVPLSTHVYNGYRPAYTGSLTPITQKDETEENGIRAYSR